MKYFSMIGAMDTAMLERFIDFSNNNHQESWAIVLNTSGGGFWPTETMGKIINEHDKDVQVIVQGAYSSGFLLLNSIKRKIILSKTCRGMWHYGKWDLQYNDKGKPYYYDDECIIRNLPFHKRHSESLAKKVMTTKEFKHFKDDKDVYFDFKRMKQIFPDAEVMK